MIITRGTNVWRAATHT